MKFKKLARLLIVTLAVGMSVSAGFVLESNAAAVDKLTIKIGYYGWSPADYVEKASFTASQLYGMGTVTKEYSYWDGSTRVAIDSSKGVYLTTILSAAGIDQSSIAQLDFWTADSGNGAFTSFTWGQLLGTKRYYFRDLAACFEYEEPTPVDPTPEDPTPEDPTPEDPTPQDPTPEEPTPEEPTPDQGEEAGTASLNSINYEKHENAALMASEETTKGEIKLNKDRAWDNAKRVYPMMALEENWTWYEIGTADATGTDKLGTANRFRLNFGQSSPDEKRTFNSAKQVHTIYIMFSGTPQLSADKTNIKGKVGSKHKVKITAAAIDESLEGQVMNNISWSSSNSDIVSVDANGNLKFKKKGTAIITASSGGSSVQIKVTVGDDDVDGKGTSGTGKGNGEGTGTAKKKSGENTKKTKRKLEKVEVKSNSFVLSDEASKKLRSALNRTADEEIASMNTHQDTMDEDSAQLVVQEQDMDFMNLAIGLLSGGMMIGGAAFGLARYRKQRWGKIWK